MTVTESHDSMNLRHSDGKVVAYNKTDQESNFNGYEAGTSIIKKSLLYDYGKEGKWSWEETIYPKQSGEITAYIDNTKFWDMGTPERLSKLEKFFQNS